MEKAHTNRNGEERGGIALGSFVGKSLLVMLFVFGFVFGTVYGKALVRVAIDPSVFEKLEVQQVKADVLDKMVTPTPTPEGKE
jgi:hypothetical protein